jgi:hypothetical protein
MYKYGSLDHARKFADALAGLALVEFRQLFAGFPASEPLEFMFDLVRDLQQGAQHHAETTRTDGVLADASGTAG